MTSYDSDNFPKAPTSNHHPMGGQGVNMCIFRRHVCVCNKLCVCVCVCVYIYIYIYSVYNKLNVYSVHISPDERELASQVKLNLTCI